MSDHPLILKFNNSLKGYKNNYILRGLFQFSLSLANPLFAGIAIGVETAAFTWQENKFHKWSIIAEELDKWKNIDEGLLKNADFLHCFKKIIDATEKTQNETKIRNFSRLLKASISTKKIPNINIYEEYLSILEELSYRELLILDILDKYERKYPHQNGENDYQRSIRFWEQFAKDLNKKLQIPTGLIDVVLLRIARTGCYEIFQGYGSPTGGQGKTTLLYREIKSVIETF